MYRVGLIGYGAFGQAICHWFRGQAEFTIFDQRTRPDNPAAALSKPIIILALPAQYLADFLSKHQAQLNPQALYMDVCSVKVGPVQTLLDYLPPTSQIIATHPMFGPESAKHGLANQKIMIHPVRIEADTFQKFKDFLLNHQLHIIETSPEAHDRDMAYVQGLSHYVGRIMQELGIPDSALSTRAYRDLVDMKNVQGHDSEDLFYSIVHNNPYVKEVLDNFKLAGLKVDKKFQL